MMSFEIDFSIFSETCAFGRVSGTINSSIMPEVGDKISFPLSLKNICKRDSVKYAGYASKHFLVETRLITANRDDKSVLLLLDDLIVETRDDALAVMKYFEDAHGLFGEAFG